MMSLLFNMLSRFVMGFPHSSVGKKSACNAGDLGSIPGSGRSPGEGNGNHSSILAWKIPWTEEPGGLQSMGSQELDTTEGLNHHHQVCHSFSSKEQTSFNFTVAGTIFHDFGTQENKIATIFTFSSSIFYEVMALNAMIFEREIYIYI